MKLSTIRNRLRVALRNTLINMNFLTTDMPNLNYVCTLCSETFTRRWRGSVHNTNIHSGAATIVRLLDYIVGRVNGEFAASDPSWYRRPNKNASWAKRASTPDYKNRREFRDFLGNRIPAQSDTWLPNPDRGDAMIQKQRDSTIHEEDKLSERINKLAELKRLASKYLSPEEVQNIINVTCVYCVDSGDCAPLDIALEEIRKKVKLRESLDYLNQS